MCSGLSRAHTYILKLTLLIDLPASLSNKSRYLSPGWDLLQIRPLLLHQTNPLPKTPDQSSALLEEPPRRSRRRHSSGSDFEAMWSKFGTSWEIQIEGRL